MKKLHSKKLNKFIISIIVAVMLCNFVMPNYCLAVSTENGGSFIKPLAKLLCFLPDAANNLMQHMFVSEDDIKIKEADTSVAEDAYNFLDSGLARAILYGIPGLLGANYFADMLRESIESGALMDAFNKEVKYDEYKMLYSPAIIFSGTVPALDIDFIGADGIEDTTEASIENFVVHYNDRLVVTDENEQVIHTVKFNEIDHFYEDIQDALITFSSTGRLIKNDGSLISLSKDSNDEITESEYTRKVPIHLKNDVIDGFNIACDGNSTWEISESTEAMFESSDDKTSGKINDDAEFTFNQEDGRILKLNLNDVSVNGNKRDIEIWFLYRVRDLTITNPDTGTSVYYIHMYSGHGLNNREAQAGKSKEYRSSAAILQSLVAKWYKAFRRIALVCLLSALVYIGIRIVLSSSSAQEKAKYKKMLKDWLTALCLLFMLHYIMNLTVVVVNQLTKVIGVSLVGSGGEDLLLTSLRNKIARVGSWSTAIIEIILYDVITVFTIIYTIQYVRRVIYLAFLTMIAPLITLTYPLDKIKDSKAQAFDMWIKDYVFFVLLQVVHMLLYYILVGQSLEMAYQGNWLYAIVVIGFLTKAEGILKKMFGFEKSKSMGALAAGATGALVVNAINKVSQMTSKKKKTKQQEQGGGKKSSGNVRTASTNPLAGLMMAQNMPTPEETPQGDMPQGGEENQEGVHQEVEEPQEETPQENTPEGEETPQAGGITLPGMPQGGEMPTQGEQPEGQGGARTQSRTQPGGTELEDILRRRNPRQEEGQEGTYRDRQTRRGRTPTGPMQLDGIFDGAQVAQTEQDIRMQTDPLRDRFLDATLALNEDAINNNHTPQRGNTPRQTTPTRQQTYIARYDARERDGKDTIKGVKALYKRYGSPTVKTVNGIILGGVGLTAGFAAGVSQGDVGKALTGAAAGATAGYYGGQRLTSAVENTAHGVSHLRDTVNEVKDTYNQGARGQEYVQNERIDREFFKGEGFAKLKAKHPEITKKEVQKMLNAGITDAKKMDKILTKVKKFPQKYNVDKAIAFATLAEKCPESIMYDDRKFIKYMQDKKINISQSQIKEFRRSIVDFK